MWQMMRTAINAGVWTSEWALLPVLAHPSLVRLESHICGSRQNSTVLSSAGTMQKFWGTVQEQRQICERHTLVHGFHGPFFADEVAWLGALEECWATRASAIFYHLEKNVYTSVIGTCDWDHGLEEQCGNGAELWNTARQQEEWCYFACRCMETLKMAPTTLKTATKTQKAALLPLGSFLPMTCRTSELVRG